MEIQVLLKIIQILAAHTLQDEQLQPMSHLVVFEMFKISLLGLEVENEKVLKCTKEYVWHEEMQNVKESMLACTVFHKELKKIKEIMKPCYRLYSKHFRDSTQCER